MPIKPNINEDKETFISRCISTEVKKGHEPNQATAMCYSIWENNLRRVLLTEDFKIEDAKEFIERGYTLHIQSNRIAPIISEELRNKLKEVNIDENKVYFAPISKLMSIHDYKLVLTGTDPILDTLLLKGTRISPNGKIIAQKAINSIQEAEEFENEYLNNKLSIDNKLAKVKITYRYGLREGVTGGPIIDTTRDFCRKLVTENLEYTLQQIKDLDNESGTNTFLYCGGFWRQKGTGDTKPYCRHQWYATAELV